MKRAVTKLLTTVLLAVVVGLLAPAAPALAGQTRGTTTAANAANPNLESLSPAKKKKKKKKRKVRTRAFLGNGTANVGIKVTTPGAKANANHRRASNSTGPTMQRRMKPECGDSLSKPTQGNVGWYESLCDAVFGPNCLPRGMRSGTPQQRALAANR